MTEKENNFIPENEDGGGVNISKEYSTMEPNEFWEYIMAMPSDTKVVLEADMLDVPPDVVNRILLHFSAGKITLNTSSEITQLERNMYPSRVKLVYKP